MLSGATKRAAASAHRIIHGSLVRRRQARGKESDWGQVSCVYLSVEVRPERNGPKRPLSERALSDLHRPEHALSVL